MTGPRWGFLGSACTPSTRAGPAGNAAHVQHRETCAAATFSLCLLLRGLRLMLYVGCCYACCSPAWYNLSSVRHSCSLHKAR